MTIKRNRIRCLKCLEVIESKHRHDYVVCKCGDVAADGGTSYLRRATMSEDARYEEVGEDEA